MTYFAVQWLILALNTSVQVLLLAGLVSIVLRLGRFSDSNLRHRVWMGVLFGMLLLPAFSRIVPAVGLPRSWEERLLAAQLWAEGGEEELAAVPSDSPLSSAIAVPDAPSLPGERHEDLSRGIGPNPSPPRDIFGGGSLPGTLETAHENQPIAAAVPSMDRVESSSNGQGPWLVARWPLLLMTAWSLGAVVMLLRLGLGFLAIRRIQSSSTAIEYSALEQKLQRLPIELSGQISLREAESISAPLTYGYFRPKILLPLDWREWAPSKLQAVLVHEGTHVRRGDFAIALLAELNRCVYWFHPVAWWLRSRLAMLAESACDDAAIESVGDRAAYARHLLEVAAAVSQSHGRLMTASISMARCSHVEMRINSILDFTRPLSRRLSGMAALALLALIVPLVGLTAALRPTDHSEGGGQPPEETANAISEAIEASDTASKDESLSSKTEQTFGTLTVTEAETTEKELHDDLHPLHITGRVLDPAGKLMPGVEVRVIKTNNTRLRGAPSNSTRLVTLVTDAKGQFKYTIEPKQLPKAWLSSQNLTYKEEINLIAMQQGLGLAISNVDRANADKSIDLQFTADETIRGRVLSLEGKPIPKVKIDALGIAPADVKKLDAWLAKLRAQERHQGNSNSVSSVVVFSNPDDQLQNDYPFPQDFSLAPGEIPFAETDEEGRFELHGLGKDRRIVLRAQAPGYAFSMPALLTRPMDPIAGAGTIVAGGQDLRGSTFELILSPSTPVEGVVTDEDSGEPIANAVITNDQVINVSAGSLLPGMLTTTTDKNGRYRLDGFQSGNANKLQVVIPGQPYLPIANIEVPESKLLTPIQRDIQLKRAIWATGQVTDIRTGKPVEGRLFYSPFKNNEHIKDHSNFRTPNFELLYFSSGSTDGSGQFRIPVIPGRGVIGFTAYEDRFRTGIGAASISEFADLKTINTEDMPTVDFISPRMFHALGEVNALRDATETAVNLHVDAGGILKLRFVDRQGKPLTKVRAFGLKPINYFWTTVDDVATVESVSPDDVRTLKFDHKETGLKRIYELRPAVGEKERTITLEQPAIVIGRLVRPDDTPWQKMPIECRFNTTAGKLDSYGNIQTDADGRFQYAIPVGAKNYQLVALGERFATLCENLVVSAGEQIELGELVIDPKIKNWQKAVPKAPEKRISAGTGRKKDETSQKTNKQVDSVNVRGIVLLPDGKPAAGAMVAVIAETKRMNRGGDLEQPSLVVAETVADQSGRYRLDLAGLSSKTHRSPYLIARAEGFGLAWKEFDPDVRDTELTIELKPEQVIRGRLVDIEGRPAAGVQAYLWMIKDRKQESLGLGGIWITHQHMPAAWPQSIATDKEGRFTLSGVPRDHGVRLTVLGNESFAPQNIAINSGMPEQRGERDGTYRSQVVNSQGPEDELTSVLSPAQWFTGTVRYADTEKPAPHARLTIYSSQEELGSWYGLGGRADEHGHYRINPHPGTYFNITAYPPVGAPYLARSADDIEWKGGTRSKTIDVVLPRGVIVRGRVIDEDSGDPIAGASVQYDDEELNNPNHSDDYITGWPGMEVADSEGRFQIVVLPGIGRLRVQAPRNEYIFHETSDRELHRGRPGGRRIYAHAIERIDLDAGAEPQELAIRLKRGATVSGTLVDATGASVQKASLITALHIWDDHWRGGALDVRNGKFEISGLKPGKEYPLYFLDAERQLGATVLAKAGMQPPRVTLEPCGKAAMRFVDDDGEPVPNYGATPYMVVTPGSSTFDRDAVKAGALTADEDSVSNIDRTNYWAKPCISDEAGRATIPALIPGATYRIVVGRNGGLAAMGKEFQAVAGKTVELGDIVTDRPK